MQETHVMSYVFRIIHSAFVASSLHTAKYFYSRLRRLSIVHNNYGSIKIRAVTQCYSTRTDWWSADYTIDQGMVLPPSASCFHGSHAVDVAACRGRGISWYLSHVMRSTLQLGYYSLACDANHVTWSDWRPDYVAQFRNLYTVQYYSQDNRRASTDRGSLTRYMRGGAFDGAFKALWVSWFAFMALLTQRC